MNLKGSPWGKNLTVAAHIKTDRLLKQKIYRCAEQCTIQGDQDHFLAKEMLISLSILKLHKNP